MKRFFSWHIITIIIFAMVLGFFDAPGSFQKKILPWIPEGLTKQRIHLGLDLQGGSQLDYKIDLRKVPEKDQEQIIGGVIEVIEKRVNALGVSEPNIYLSKVGEEQHIIVELAEVKDLEEAKKTVGKTIQLEFKEQKAAPDPDEEKRQRTYAEEVLKKALKNPENFSILGQEEQQANAGKVRFDSQKEAQFFGSIGDNLQEPVKKLKPGEVYAKLIDVAEEYLIGSDGGLQKSTGLYIIKLVEKEKKLRFEKEVDTSHILISYKGAKSAAVDITRTEEEGKKRAQEVFEKAKKGEDFAKLAQEFSDDPGSKTNGGLLDAPVNKDAAYVAAYKDGALALEKEGDLSQPIKSEFGYHIIKADKILKNIEDEKVKLEKLFISTMPDPWQETGLTGEHFVHADVQFDDQFFQPYVSIRFNEEGAKLFEEITGKNVGRPLAIFVGGNIISAPNVNTKISGGVAQITGRFTVEETQQLARDLNTGAIPAPIILAGQHTIGSTLGQDALQKSLKAGLIGIVLIAVFMIGYYRLPGLLATIALAIYAITLIFVIKSELPLSLSLIIATTIFGVILYKILNSNENKGEKFLSFLLSVVILFFISSVLSNAITLTLAGVAGVILSIGMAVDANILIFERMKEELHSGHSLAAAIETGFERAWSSIRDSNFSSLITCAILFYFGSSLIRGFALNLAIGIVISMFTAITITRTLLRATTKTKLAEKLALFVKPKTGEKHILRIIENTKVWFGLSGGLILASLFALVVFGVRLGMDFTGGTFMEIKFKEAVSVEQLKKSLGAIEESFKTDGVPSEPAQTVEGDTGPLALTPLKPITELKQNEEFDIKSAQIIIADDGSYQIKTKFISTDIHDAVINELKNKHGELTESRFETVGAIIGDTMKKRAVIALLIASMMIMVYLAFAFRKIPKYVNPWRFGICAIIALMHDLFITFGLFLFLGKFANVEIDALFITALLTILGFSVHDTIVVFDRIRERLKDNETGEITAIANQSLTETMSRSINTSISTLLTLIALLIFGSQSIFYFTLALAAGIIVGTYSSIYIASPILVLWTKWAMEKKEKNLSPL